MRCLPCLPVLCIRWAGSGRRVPSGMGRPALIPAGGPSYRVDRREEVRAMLELWDEMMGLERRMDDVFRTYLGPRARITFPAFREGLRRPFVPATDVFARKGDLVVRLELPGVDPKKDVKVTVDDGVLVIKGERESTEEIEDEDFYRMESCYGSFERDVPIPEGVKEKDI